MKEVEIHAYKSCRELGKLTHADHKTVSSKMKIELEMKRKSLHWIPYRLQPKHIEVRKELAAELNEFLKLQEPQKFARVFTGDESWIMYENPPKFVWVGKGMDTPEHERLTVSAKKLLLTVFFSGERVWHISFLPVGQSMNGERFIETVLKPLHEEIEHSSATITSPWFLHYDNARPHVCIKTKTYLKSTNFIRLEAPPYSPDLAPSDFYLVGILKAQLEGQSFITEESLKLAVTDFLRSLGEKELRSSSWTRALSQED
jgi:histone-lysine N-methyltransferase SETMAR